MTTNACLITLSGPDGSIGFTTTATDDAWTASKDNVSTMNLFEVAKGKRINAYMGSYTAGSGMIRVRNTVTNRVKMLEALSMPKGMVGGIVPLSTPFTVEQDDILEIYTTAAGS